MQVKNLNKFLGKKIDKQIIKTEFATYSIRVHTHMSCMTAEYNPKRVNFVLDENEVITQVYIG